MTEATAETTTPKRLNYFERYLSVWVGACMIVGVLLGRAMPIAADALRLAIVTKPEVSKPHSSTSSGLAQRRFWKTARSSGSLAEL